MDYRSIQFSFECTLSAGRPGIGRKKQPHTESVAQLTLCRVTGEEIETAIGESLPETPEYPSSAPADH